MPTTFALLVRTRLKSRSLGPQLGDAGHKPESDIGIHQVLIIEQLR